MGNGKKVTVFGAGVSGLTAAHELVVRGFDVTVVDPNINEFVEDGTFDRGVGGMARSQWGVDVSYKTDRTMEQLIPASEFQIDRKLKFVREDPTIEKSISQARDLIARVTAAGRNCPLRIHLSVEQPPAPAPADASADARADASAPVPVAESVSAPPRAATAADPAPEHPDYTYICRLLEGIPNPKRYVRLDTVPKADAGILSYTVSAPVMAGEHGFRFFPSFYRHVFDTMKRTPVLEPKPSEGSPKTVFENLVPVDTLGFGRDGTNVSFPLPRRPVRSFEEFRRNMQKVLSELDWTVEDLSRFSLKLFEYMTSCTERRAAQYEHMSWSDFVGLPSYSPVMRRHIEFGPQMMLSLRGSRSDARTQGTAVVQLLLDQLREGNRPDATLAAPTSSAWFDHWHDFLTSQGVKFRCGELKALRLEGQKLVPWVDSLNPADPSTTRLDDAAYVVVALPIVELSKLAISKDFASLADSRDLQTAVAFLPPESSPEYPMRDMNGIQYYFDTEVRFWHGHTQYLDSEWGLTSISQPQFWWRARDPEDHYRSVLSVDLGIWDQPTKPSALKTEKFGAGMLAVTALQCDAAQLAREVWAQIADHHDDAFVAAYGPKARIPEPIAFALDSGLTFKAPNVRSNKYPFLVNMVHQYPRRPGALPDKAPKAASEYAVCGGVVLAGTHMKTYTRITSMEAANESARHAVNAILRVSETPCDRCEIWDPEDNELDELQWLRDLDAKNFSKGLPHFAKILDWDELPTVLLPSMFGGTGGNAK